MRGHEHTDGTRGRTRFFFSATFGEHLRRSILPSRKQVGLNGPDDFTQRASTRMEFAWSPSLSHLIYEQQSHLFSLRCGQNRSDGGPRDYSVRQRPAWILGRPGFDRDATMLPSSRSLGRKSIRATTCGRPSFRLWPEQDHMDLTSPWTQWLVIRCWAFFFYTRNCDMLREIDDGNLWFCTITEDGIIFFSFPRLCRYPSCVVCRPAVQLQSRGVYGRHQRIGGGEREIHSLCKLLRFSYSLYSTGIYIYNNNDDNTSNRNVVPSS